MGSMGDDDRAAFPRSIRHKRILDEAADRPDATCRELAERIPSATTDLVERILDRYGDPAESDDDGESGQAETNGDSTAGSQSQGGDPYADDPSSIQGRSLAPETDGGPDQKSNTTETQETALGAETGEVVEPADESNNAGPAGPDADTDPTSDGDADDGLSSLPGPEELTDTQLETLRAICSHPDATQRELGDVLDVSPATVCNRVHGIRSFEWADRYAIARTVLEPESDDRGQDDDEMPSNDSEDSKRLDRLEERVADIEERLEEGGPATEGSPFGDDPELAHKVIRTCFKSQEFSEEEELRLLEAVLR